MCYQFKLKIMRTTKSTKIIYWTATVIIFLFEGVVPALTSHTAVAVEGRHLGYPDYFPVMFFPLLFLAILATSYIFYHKLKKISDESKSTVDRESYVNPE